MSLLRRPTLAVALTAAIAAAHARPLVTVLPEVIEQPAGYTGPRRLRIPADAGYQGTEFAF